MVFDQIVTSVMVGFALFGNISLAHAQSRQDPPQLASARRHVDSPLVFDNVTVIDVEHGARLTQQRVVITGTRIQAVGDRAAIRMPANARVVNADGKYLIPGLWDMSVNPHEYIDIAGRLFIANGVTGIRDVGNATPLATMQQWKREITAGTRVGPRLLVSGPRLVERDAEGPSALGVLPSTPRLNIPDSVRVRAARHLIDSLHAAGANVLQFAGLERNTWFAFAAEARRRGLRFGGHLIEGVTLLPGLDSLTGREASDSGITFLDHETWVGDAACGSYHEFRRKDSLNVARCTQLAAQFRRNGSWVVISPTMIGFLLFPRQTLDRARRYLPDSLEENSPLANFRDPSYLKPNYAGRYTPRSITDWREAQQRYNHVVDSVGLRSDKIDLNFTAAEKASMPTLVGTDAGYDSFLMLQVPGFAVQEALANFVLGGLQPLTALQTATINPALALHATDSLGTVANGKLADLVLLDADPLEDIWNTSQIRAVVANGRYYDRQALDQLLSDAEHIARTIRAPGQSPTQATP